MGYGPCLALPAKLDAFLWDRKLPCALFPRPHIGLVRAPASKGFTQLPFCTESLILARANVSGFERLSVDATALSFATVRWRGI